MREADYENVMYENQTLYSKLENLENVFIGQPSRRPNTMNSTADNLTQEYADSTLQLENNELKRRIAIIEQEKAEMREMLQ